MKQYAPACDRNRGPIADVLRRVLPARGRVLEIGSGTGQHAAWFARDFPSLAWQPSDLAVNHPSIAAWAAESRAPNLSPALKLDLLADDWPRVEADAVVCINVLHIVSWRGVVNLFSKAPSILGAGGVLYVYGACRYRDRPLEPSNAWFDRWLRERDPESGIRYFEDVDELARDSGLVLVEDAPMPSNNRSIWWRKRLEQSASGGIARDTVQPHLNSSSFAKKD